MFRKKNQKKGENQEVERIKNQTIKQNKAKWDHIIIAIFLPTIGTKLKTR